MRAKFGLLEQTHGIGYAYMPNFVSIGLFCSPLAAKNRKFCHFWTSAFCGVAIWRQSEKTKHGYTTTNLSSLSITVSLLQRLHGEIVCINSDVQKSDGGLLYGVGF